MMTFWFLLTLGFLTLELFNPGLFFCLALSLGAFCTLLANYFAWTPVHLYAIFFTTSAIMFLILNKFVKRMRSTKQNKLYQSNMQLLIGQTIQVDLVTTPTTGYAKIYGDDWPIKLHETETLTAGANVQVIGVQGCHLIVKLIKN